MTEPDRILLQTWVTREKYPRLYAWASSGQADKSATLRQAADWYLFGMRARLDRIEALLLELVEEGEK